ncbi:hypothetical protein HYC85_029987 [Camellia sinensis]|uniref:DC1 domain-containing protein n=1 Tax=Camellia sinensis TaxID=4442 RepID=A0A7J7G3F0_CAMSI|nr:hypothetical protein HYC85_029987 [Camellia sinensis]
MCSTCDFWIHEDCALLPTTFKYRGHVHPLTLCYSSLYDASCRICQEGFRNYQWSYQCRGCQYHAHANCATKTKEIETVAGVEELDMTNLFHLPMPDESINLFNQFVEQLNVLTVNLINQFVEQLDLEHASNKIEAKLYNSIHSHPLILFDVDSEDNLCSMSKLSIHNDEQKNEKICDACVQPIPVPFYGCSHSQCDFFMHKCCVELPIEIQHPCHPHPLSLDNRSSYFGWFTCRGCGKQCNGFTFQCTTDECTFNETFYLDVNLFGWKKMFSDGVTDKLIPKAYGSGFPSDGTSDLMQTTHHKRETQSVVQQLSMSTGSRISLNFWREYNSLRFLTTLFFFNSMKMFFSETNAALLTKICNF